jgi:hypothetical protein
MRKIFALGFCALLFAISPAAAKECPPLKQLAAIKLERPDPDGPFFVPVKINGVARQLLLDTGFTASRLYRTAADELKLPIARRPLRMGGQQFGAQDQAHIESLVLGSGQFTNSDLPLFNNTTTPPHDMAGILGMDILSHFDVDLDLANGMLNLFDVDHCSGQVVHWKADNVAVMPIRYDLIGRIIMPVKLDSKTFNATLDTAMPDNTMYLPALRKSITFEVDPAEVTPLSDAPEAAKNLRHRFTSLELPGVTVANPMVALWDDKTYTARSLKRPAPATVLAIGGRSGVVDQFALGFNTLSKMHVYIAMKERKLYVSAASPPQ